jgi:hypothetical protein
VATSNDKRVELNNNHNVYVLGAGFSAFRGLPLMQDFMHRMRDAYDHMVRSSRNDEANAIARVLEFRRDSAAAAYLINLDLEDIEELFSLASVLGEDYSIDLRLAIAATLSFSQEVSVEPHFTIQHEIRKPFTFPKHWKPSAANRDSSGNYNYLRAPSYEVLVQGLLGQLGSGCAPGNNSLLSFNYDLLIETALSSLGQEFSYGFDTTQEMHQDQQGSLRHNQVSTLKLLKLHGSMNWSTNPTTGTFEIFESYEKLRTYDRVPHLIPPTWRKSFTPALQSVWKEAINSIRAATRLIIIGLSIRPADLHLKYLLAAGLRNNLSLREIVFFDPAEAALKLQIESLFSDVERLPTVQVFGRRAETLISPGTGRGTMSECGRPITRAISSVDRELN